MLRNCFVVLCTAIVVSLAGCGNEAAPQVSDGWDDSDGFVVEIEDYDGNDDEVEGGEPEIPEVKLDQFDVSVEDARLLLKPEDGETVVITSRNQLAALAVLVNTGDTEYIQYKYELGNNINLTGYDFTPIGGGDDSVENAPAFNAVLDGNGYIISGLTIRDNGFAYATGLFGVIGPQGRVSRLHIIEGDVRGRQNTGGFAGVNQGALYDCSFRGTVASTYGPVGGVLGRLEQGEAAVCASNAFVSGSYQIGGLIGSMEEGTNASDCYALGSVTSTEGENGAEATILGGLIGSQEGEMRRAFCVVEVYTKVPSSLVGSVVGNNLGEISDCYFREDIVANWKAVGNIPEGEEAEGVTGLTVEEITEQDTFAGWDFTEIWDIREDSNRGLPFHR